MLEVLIGQWKYARIRLRLGVPYSLFTVLRILFYWPFISSEDREEYRDAVRKEKARMTLAARKQQEASNPTTDYDE
jgi:hypothetical protein